MSLVQIPADWPHRAASALVPAAGLTWHVQRLGSGPVALLLHGTAASTHSFRTLAEALAENFEVVMIDLPGHGFSSALPAPGLPRVAEALGVLLKRLEINPSVAVGHSAGAAVAIRMALDGAIAPDALVGLAPALKPYGGAAEGFASQMARWTALNPVAPRLVAWNASSARVAKLIAQTGSQLDEPGIAFYTRLLREPRHVEGALQLMANWSLRPLQAELGDLTIPLTLVVGEKDRATPLRDVEHAARLVAGSTLIRLPGLGHLAHEEDPARAAEIIRTVAQAAAAPEFEAELRSAAAGG